MWVWKEEDVKKGEDQHSSLFNERIQNSASNYIDTANVAQWIGIGGAVILIAIGIKVFFTPGIIDGLINFLSYIK
jgi:hypothetical protein